MNIPEAVKKELRQEVGFVCPVSDCGSPYLTFHHFDPPRREEEHNRPDGMIALCMEHHKFADGGGYTKDQLHALKRNPAGDLDTKRQKLVWMTKEPIVAVGGVYTRFVPNLLEFFGEKALWLTNDSFGYTLVNLSMAGVYSNPMVLLRDNCWEYGPSELPIDVVCKPGGKELKVCYETGDSLELKFKVFETVEEATSGCVGLTQDQVHFMEAEPPIVVVSLNGVFGGGELEITPQAFRFRGKEPQKMRMDGCTMEHCGVIVEMHLPSLGIIMSGCAWKYGTGPILQVF